MNIFDALKSINPEEIGKALMGMRAEIDGFKAGFTNVVSHFNSRLDNIEAHQREIISLLTKAKLNGHSTFDSDEQHR